MPERTRILVVDDESRVRSMIHQYLTAEGYDVTTVGTGHEALEAVRRDDVQLVILDWMLPGGLNGLEVCREIRKISSVAVIMLTAKTEETDMIVGLEMGADDYVTKPFRMRELTARIRTVLRRTQQGGEASPANVLTRGSLVIEPDKFTVRKDGEDVILTPAEFKILVTLATRPGVVFSRLQLSEVALGDDYIHYERSIDTHISHLRKKIESNPSQPEYIQTVYGIGYRFGVPV
ncbi:response regulator transcription factor [Alicyclobacillus ferrooxydans]|uniref:PhoP family transcriptional regulator n=1 Tax=Alicyclobacillus ferrooxydans TaxID=471514 RepID=A0A0P9EZD7_9BACL|nr:response regulator transcription factor [Alicyclobacillus ferrooxydans]KPV44460.1 PhoP family transcriptional regulator [Alicyclobacillus ferrooxydans]